VIWAMVENIINTLEMILFICMSNGICSIVVMDHHNDWCSYYNDINHNTTTDNFGTELKEANKLQHENLKGIIK
jgi:hypothetical protein